MRATTFAATAALLTSQFTHAIDLDLSSDDSIKAAAKSVAQGLVQGYYTNQSNVPGLLGDTYFFWSAGAMWDTLVNYWYLTGDSTYNDVASQALLFQVGDNNDYMPANQTKDLGNDDQATWALAALTAAERKFPNPPSGKPQWIDLAKNVFDEQVNRWDNSTCDGGLRWQIFPFNNGYDYKQAQSFFFLLAARLAQNTGNATYSQWAEMAYNWTSTTLMSDQFAVYDGAQVAQNCSQASKLEWSYNQAAFLYGSAVMFNMTSSTMWQQRVMGHLQHFSSTFFYGNGTSSSGSGTILYEPACEVNNKCSTDQTFFKGLTSRWMAQTIVSAPFTSAKITPLLQASAKGAAAACTSGSDGADCGFHWYTGSNDGLKGAGEQLSALEAIQQSLKQEAPSSSSTNTSSPSPTGSNSPSHTAQGGMGATVHVTWSVLFAGVLAALF